MNSKEITKFEEKIKKTILDYKLLNKKEKVFVACSGGKDSTTILYLLKKFGYDVEGIMIDLKIGEWSQHNLENVSKFCSDNKIKLNVIDIRENLGSSMCFIRSSIQAKEKLNNCTICGTIRRWLINKKSRELGAKKLVTGHNLDDEVENIFMNFFQGNLKLGSGLGPTSGVTKNKGFVQRVKPLYFCSNEEIRDYSKTKKFPVLYEPCPCSSNAFRGNVRKMIKELEKENPKIKINTVKSFLRILEKLKEKYSMSESVSQCKFCGEPCRSDICKTCSLLGLLKSE